MNTLLGISIPTYKRPEQLLATVRSVAAAGGLEHEIPVYIADDSLDDTNVATLATLAGEYPFLMVRRNERNLGIDGNILNSVNINECRYAWLLGEDDRLVPGAVTKMLAVLESSTAPFLYANYSSVNSDFSRVLKPASLALAGDAVQSADTFWRQSAWSAGFIGACVVNKAAWQRVEQAKYVGTWFAHVGVIMEAAHGHDIPMLAEPLILNRCGTTEVFTWTSTMMDVLDGWRRLCVLLEPLYGASACRESLHSFRRAHGLGTLKFLAYARAGGALTLAVVREHILPGNESAWFKGWARIVARLPAGWFRTLQRWKHHA